MKRLLPVLVLGLLLAPAAMLAATQPKAGTYEVTFLNPTGGTIYCLVKLTPKGDGVEGELVSAHPQLRGLGLKSVALDGDMLKVILSAPGSDMSFEGRVPKAGADMILGTFESGGRLNMGRVAITDKTTLTPANTSVRVDLPEPMQKVQTLTREVAQLRQRAAKAKAKDEKAKLAKEAADADKQAQAEQPKLYREVIEKHPDSLAVATAAQYLIRQAGKEKMDAAQVRGWATALLKVAKPYGERYENEVVAQIAEMLVAQAGYADQALQFAQWAEKGLTGKEPTAQQVRVLNLVAKAQKAVGRAADAEKTTARVTKLELDGAVAAEKALTATDPQATQVRVLNALAAAQKKSGMTADAAKTTARVAKMEMDNAVAAEKALTDKDPLDKQAAALTALAAAQRKSGMTAEAERTEASLEKIDVQLDREYHATMPPFKPTAFEGRKGQSDRVAVMELFTGAQCPPCIAADLAFDGLMKTYKHNDVVLIQYHMHIPGPDPMTNTATEARWDYYREKFPGEIGGVPSTLFNGEPQGGGGGGAPQSEAKYKQYRDILDELLEKPAGASLNLSATRAGDRITIQADVSKLAEPGEGKKLRLLLAEESIRFLGSNKIRFHHMVVRAMPGGPDGMALTQKESKHTASVNLAELRQELTKYLDEYAAEKRPFPQPGRPLAFKDLKVIALVQDDKTGEILQAKMVDIGGDRAQP